MGSLVARIAGSRVSEDELQDECVSQLCYLGDNRRLPPPPDGQANPLVELRALRDLYDKPDVEYRGQVGAVDIHRLLERCRAIVASAEPAHPIIGEIDEAITKRGDWSGLSKPSRPSAQDLNLDDLADSEQLTLIQSANLTGRLVALGLDYTGAFDVLREAMRVVGNDAVQSALQSYLNHLRGLLLAKPEPQVRGHFGSLEENKAFAKALNEMLDLTNLRLSTEHGPATLVANRQPGGRPSGRFQMATTSGSTRGSFPEMPQIVLVARPRRLPRKVGPPT